MWFTYILIATIFWALTNSVDSLLIRSYEKRAVVLMCFDAVLGIWPVLAIPVFVSVQSPWVLHLGIGAFYVYFVHFAYYWVLDHIDVSVVNVVWAMQAVFLSMAGFVLFGEAWTPQQTVGALCVLGGVLLLSAWHKGWSTARSCTIFTGIALLYAPYWTLQKYVLEQGESEFVVFYWSVVFQACLGMLVPLTLSHYRNQLVLLWQRADRKFFVIVSFGIFAWYIATYLTYRALQDGPLSLAAIASNSQPFFSIIIAWLLWRFAPVYAPREVLTAQSIRVKVLSFAVVFIGLALLAI